MAFIRYKTQKASGQRYYMVVESRRGHDKKVRQKVLLYRGKVPTVRAKIEQLQTEVNDVRDKALDDRTVAEQERSSARRLRDHARCLSEETVYALPRPHPFYRWVNEYAPVTVEQYRAHLLEQAYRHDLRADHRSKWSEQREREAAAKQAELAAIQELCERYPEIITP